MHRFYFDCFDGQDLLIDQHGLALDGMHEVEDQATELIAHLLAENLCGVRHRTVFVSVRGETGPPVYCAHGGFVGRYTGHGVARPPGAGDAPSLPMP